MNLDRLLQDAITHHRAGRLKEAHAGYAAILQRDRGHPDATHLMGVLFHQTGRHDVAINLIRRAIQSRPNDAAMSYNLADALRATGRLDEALATLHRTIDLSPNNADAFSNLSLVLNELGRHEQAADAARRSIACDSNSPFPRNNLAYALARLGRIDEAIDAAKTCIQLQPDFADAHNTLGICYHWQGRFDDAIESYRTAIQHNPRHAEAYANLGVTFAKAGKIAEAIDALKHSVQLKPDHQTGWENLAAAYRTTGSKDEEAACYERLTQLAPHVANHWTNLGIIREQQHGGLDRAVDAIQRALRCQVLLEPDRVAALGTLGIARMKQGLHDEAMQLIRQSLAISKNAKLHTNLCLLANYHPSLSGEGVLAIHREWERDYAQPVAGTIEPHANDRTPVRVLRIGYVSPDFRAHASRHFIEPLLAGHDRANVRVICYSNVVRPDEATSQLRALADDWREIYERDDAEVAAMIRADQIDILVDLAGQTADARLTLFAMRPAPVQVSMVGYPSTTGLSSIDYKISDPLVDPPGAERFYSERLLRLDGTFWSFRPSEDTPPVNALPARANGFVTFGSANNIAKITPAALDLWARIVAAVPNSRMRMQHSGLASEQVQRRYRETFAKHGVAEDRLILSDWMKFTDYLDLLRTFDLALDTFPFNGGTTTCQQLYLGVPCIALAGERQVSRMGLTMLNSVGLNDLVASSIEDYFAKAVALANDLKRLEQIRTSLRDRMISTSLCSAEMYCSKLEQAYRTIWRSWCERQ